MKNSFLSDLSSPEQPIPGGGAAAAHAAAVGLALLEKVVRIEMRRHQSKSEKSPWENLLNQVLVLSNNLCRLRDEDGKIYMQLARVKKSGADQEAVTAVLGQAIDCPIKIMEQTHKALGCVAQAAKYCKRHLRSDLCVVCEILGAAGRGADHIARANLDLMADPITKADYQNRLKRLYAGGRDAIGLAEDSLLKNHGKG